MTREETLNRFKKWCQEQLGNHCSDKDAQMANNIMALLEQEPCDDAISRQAVLDIVKEYQSGFESVMNIGGKVSMEELAEDIKLLNSSVTPKQNKWVPVSERFPEEYLCDDGYVEPSDYVLVWGDHGNYGVSRYWGNRRSKSESPNTHKDWVDLDWVVQKPIAWMPLPEPYKAESEEEKNE